MLTLEIELLTEIYRATMPDRAGAEWPPHPERVFSALTQAWGDGGCDPRERSALEWLEQQSPPLIDADEFWSERSSPTVFVPPNDAQGTEIDVLPDRRARQARTFRAVVPHNHIASMHWPRTKASAEHFEALAKLAFRVASLGHSSSLVRFAFCEKEPAPSGQHWIPALEGRMSLRVPHEGRLAGLVRWHREGQRPRVGANARYRAPGDPLPSERPTASYFGGEEDWFVFEDAGGIRPDLLGCAQVASRVRAALMRLGPQPPAEILSGHTETAAPTKLPHVAVLPLANVGWDHASGDLLGFAVVLPRGVSGNERDKVLLALAAFAHLDEQENYAKLTFSSGEWRLDHAAVPSRASLKPMRWCGSAKTWLSMTPVLLDRFPDGRDAGEEAQFIAAACCNIGLPEPIEIEIHKHSAVNAAPSAYPARGKAGRPDWAFPAGAKFANRPRRHVVLHFAEPVTGPVVLGAGRFYGLGLCLPRDGEAGQ